MATKKTKLIRQRKGKVVSIPVKRKARPAAMPAATLVRIDAVITSFLLQGAPRSAARLVKVLAKAGYAIVDTAELPPIIGPLTAFQRDALMRNGGRSLVDLARDFPETPGGSIEN